MTKKELEEKYDYLAEVADIHINETINDQNYEIAFLKAICNKIDVDQKKLEKLNEEKEERIEYWHNMGCSKFMENSIVQKMIISILIEICRKLDIDWSEIQGKVMHKNFIRLCKAEEEEEKEEEFEKV